MSNQQHPITPTHEMIRKWIEDWAGGQMKGPVSDDQRVVATRAAQWGWDQRGAVNESELQKARDQELEACEKWLSARTGFMDAHDLRDYRRPKPPSLKEEALAELEEIMTELHDETGSAFTASSIRRALEALDD